MFTEGMKSEVESSIELFFTSVKAYFKNVLNSIELSLGSIFCLTHPFMKKLTTVKNSGEKSLLNNRAIFFKLEIMQWNGIINKEGFLNLHLLVSSQKQSPRGVLEKRFSQKFCKINRKTLVPESLF